MTLSDIARGLTVKVELPYIALPRLTTPPFTNLMNAYRYNSSIADISPASKICRRSVQDSQKKDSQKNQESGRSK